MPAPFVPGGKTAALIVGCLSQQWPLSAKSIHRLIRQHDQLTYQAVHKTLQDLAAHEVVVKHEGGYRLNAGFVQQSSEFWSNLHAKNLSHGIRARVRAAPSNHSPSTYSFTRSSVMVGGIPSVFISKSTIGELIENSSSKFLETLAKKIADKDFDYLKLKSYNPKKDTPAMMIDRLGRLAQDYYWGRASGVFEDSAARLKIAPGPFVSPKAKRFYEKIYVHYMARLGFQFVKRDELTNLLFFEAK